MERSIRELLDGKGGNYVLPFFWQHGEDEGVLREEMARIHGCGIGAVCVEARPHPDFAGPRWWKDMDVIMDEARNRNMRVWVLDDAHFPTGFANGAIRDKYPDKGKEYLFFRHADVSGPMPQGELRVENMARMISLPFIKPGMFGEHTPVREFDGDKLIAVIAQELGQGNATRGIPLDLSGQVKDGVLVWDVPPGMWRVFVVFKTRNGGGHPDYINIIDGEAVQVLIDEVYEPHHARYGEDFGKAFAGFFSDEPAFGNTRGYSPDDAIGKKLMPLPWSRDLPALMEESLGIGWISALPGLWFPSEEEGVAARTRYAYMDAVTRLYEDNFSNKLGEWCSARGVEYIGHIIEDNNQDTKLGSSAGHFFRALSGQHMSGIDDIGGQVLFGGHENARLGHVQGDGEFFHYALGKMGSSAAHIDPKKKGRTMCEIFGAYGWSLGISHMKWISDHFLVRGINHLVPHAFSPKDYPDSDCPPHFYARGNNPQYRHFAHLMGYCNRLCHIFNGGIHVAPAAILYHAESDWTGDGGMLMQKPARALLEAQIDFDFLPSDIFGDEERFGLSHESGRLTINGEAYSCLVVPRTDYITRSVAEFVIKAKGSGFVVVFVGGPPRDICDMPKGSQAESLIAGLRECPVKSLRELPSYLHGLGLCGIRLDSGFPMLRYYHYKKGGSQIFMLSNEDAGRTYNGNIWLPARGPAVIYDAFSNSLRPIIHRIEGDGTSVRTVLEPYQSMIVVLDPSMDTQGLQTSEDVVGAGGSIDLSEGWRLSASSPKDYPVSEYVKEMDGLVSVAGFMPDFTGVLSYEKEFDLSGIPSRACLSIEHAYEGPEVWVNGKHVGMRICPPYRFDLSGFLDEGANTIRIEVATTLDRDPTHNTGDAVFAHFFEPIGLIGKVVLHWD